MMEVDIRAKYSKGFPVYDENGKSRTEKDTITYNSEFNSFINSIKNKKNTSQSITLREQQSNISKTLVNIDYAQKDYIVIDTFSKLGNWIIHKDTLRIMKFKCQKAIVNFQSDTYTAWFTTELPYSSGPENFFGLPGLILKVSNENHTVGYEALEVKMPYENAIPNFIEIGKTISRSEWLLIVSERNKKAQEAANNYIQKLKYQMQTQ